MAPILELGRSTSSVTKNKTALSFKYYFVGFWSFFDDHFIFFTSLSKTGSYLMEIVYVISSSCFSFIRICESESSMISSVWQDICIAQGTSIRLLIPQPGRLVLLYEALICLLGLQNQTLSIPISFRLQTTRTR
eukprot:GHVP01053820.1.p1 GENE.GHVP01053820.1~~GHVP01053820.1.p1  ORF type:complete len:134 (+),score=6.74 GHVP01053820.1:1068-1469(+)